MLNLAVKMDLINMLHYQILVSIILLVSIYYKWKNVKKSFENNKFKIPQPTWDEEFEF